MRRWATILTEPIPAETRRLLARRWQELPAALRTDDQVVGRHHVHCGFTLGALYCSFSCTHCYLPNNANRVPLPTLDDMRRQIEANRRLMGPGGNLQITGGDVVDAYWHAGRPEELVTIVRLATDAGLVPMLMTHGQLLLENPWYLDQLVVDGGLRKVALHVDVTQAGRPGFPIRELDSEADLHPLRGSFVDLILGCRRRTKARLTAAHTVTVTQANLASVGEIVRWLIAEPRRLRAFRMVSFQTEAAVGRTRMSARPVTAEAVWAAICDGLGTALTRDGLRFGHPDCSSMSTVLVDHQRRRVIEVNPGDVQSRTIQNELLRCFGGVGARGEDRLAAVLRKLAVALRHPGFLWRLWRYTVGRLRREGLVSLPLRWAKGEVGALNLVLHNFMSAAQVHAGGATIEARLAACSFRGAVKRDGHWEAVPMCELNAGLREELYRSATAGAATSDRATRRGSEVG